MNEIMVSIICNTFNQEKYIERAIKGFLMQKTDFRYEVILHDDASTDGTADIVRKYEKKYPDIIKPIYETENQYSKNVKITLDISLPKAKGKYFAMCEGDDYWVDPYKLQKQVDYMESHPDCTLCIHNALLVNSENKKIGYVKTAAKNSEIPMEEVIRRGGGMCATNSILAPTAMMHDVPEFYRDYSIDYFLQAYLSANGKTFCFADAMSAYRVNADNSWTGRMRKSKSVSRTHYVRVINSLKKLNLYTDYKYQKEIGQKVLEFEFSVLMMDKDYQRLGKEPYKSYIKSLPFKEKIQYHLERRAPFLLNIIKKIRIAIFE